MESSEINNKQKQIVLNIIEGRIAKALPLLSELVFASHQGDYRTSLDGMEETYKNILKYSFGQAKDPERETIYNNLKRHLIDLTDDVSVHLTNSNDNWLKSLRKEDEGYLNLGEQEKKALIDELTVDKEFSSILDELAPENSSDSETSKNYIKTLNTVFEILWLKSNYSEGEKQLTTQLINSSTIPWYDKSLIVSAITLSLFKHFDIPKVELLFNIYQQGQKQLSQRALVGLIFSLFLYKDRLELYPEVFNRIKTIADPKLLAKQTEQIIIQLIKAQETEKVTEKIQKEIIPEVMKIKPEIEEKLHLEDLINKDELEDKNPDWEDFFSESPDVYKKLEEFSMMQMDGSDVFMGAFSMLKRFGFFEQFSNWFLPFYQDHPELKNSISDMDTNFNWNSFFEGIEKAPVMCNSDKYSFCFNLGFMPEMQKTMMLEMFGAEIKQMSEIAEDEKQQDSTIEDRFIFTQYIQDLYRFFKLHPKKSHFTDVFDTEINLDHSFLKEIFYESNSYRKLGEFYFEKNYYSSALEIFNTLIEEEKSFELIEKSGFCYQKLGAFEKAIKKYKDAEIFNNKRAWLDKKLGFCYRKIGDFDTAIEYYKKVEKDEPDNLEIQACLGQLHIDKEDYKGALKYYFKVEYLRPNFAKAQRPIGWCSFILKNPEQAIRYFKKVIESESNASDYLNLAHANWVSGLLPNAIENYRLAIKCSGGNIDWFSEAMQKDALYLNSYGIDLLEINLMTDYLLLDN